MELANYQTYKHVGGKKLPLELKVTAIMLASEIDPKGSEMTCVAQAIIGEVLFNNKEIKDDKLIEKAV